MGTSVKLVGIIVGLNVGLTVTSAALSVANEDANTGESLVEARSDSPSLTSSCSKIYSASFMWFWSTSFAVFLVELFSGESITTTMTASIAKPKSTPYFTPFELRKGRTVRLALRSSTRSLSLERR